MIKYFKKFSLIRSVFSFNQDQRDRWIQQIAPEIKAGATVLDVGAGSAPYRALFKHTLYQTHDFCQLRPEQLLGGKGYTPIDYVSEITSIPVPDSSFDCILCTEVLEHVPEPLKAIQEMLRICKPGGCILLSAPLGSGLHQTPFHFYGGYTPYFYKFALESNGASIKSITPNGNFFRLYAQESLRFSVRSAPWKLNVFFLFKIIWAPFWLFGLLCTLISAFFGYSMDRYDTNTDFTVGYHVVALKNG
jgi:ubiquinone/menaquinone biosynthesis C-methylase UbiE